jgi:hypothetical protein
MIGRQSVEVDAFVVGASETLEQDVKLAVTPVELTGLAVSAQRRCDLRESAGRATQTVWQEAKKALAAQVATRDEASYRFDLGRFERVHSLETGRLEYEVVHQLSGIAGDPFESRPAEILADSGYHSGTDDGAHVLFGPNADVLLSDSFLETHCFWLTRDQRHQPGGIGLAFEPIRGRRVTDVEGTLWLDERSAELRTLEFAYTRLPADVPREPHTGIARFERLPDGRWIVGEWMIRMPLAKFVQGNSRRPSSMIVDGRKEDGGRVVRVLARDGSPVAAAMRASLAGVVIDGTTGNPLERATVFLVGTGISTTTDANGAFEITGLTPGSYDVAFWHPRIEAFEVDAEPLPVELAQARASRIVLAIPESARARGNAASGVPVVNDVAILPPRNASRVAVRLPSTPAHVTGRVIDGPSNGGLAGATVHIADVELSVVTSRGGWFAFPAVRPGRYRMTIDASGRAQQEFWLTVQSGSAVTVTARLARR